MLQQLRLSQKFLLIGGLAALLAAAPSALWLRGTWSRLADTEREHAALAPAAAGVQAAGLTAVHRGLSMAALAGDAQAGSRRAEVASSLLARQKSALEAIAVLDDGALSRRAEDLWRQRQALVGEVAAGGLQPAQSFARHSALVDAELALVADLVEHSGLARHPQVAGFHLQQAALQQLPRLAELVGQMRGTGVGLLAQGQLDEGQRARVAVLIEQIGVGAQAATRAITLARSDEPDLAQTLDAPLAQAASSLDAALTLARQALVEAPAGAAPGTNASDWWQLTTRAVDAQTALGASALTAMTAQLDAERAAQWRALALALAVLLALGVSAALLGWRIARSTTRSIRDAIGRADAVAAGDLASADAGPASGASSAGADEGAQLRAALASMSAQLRRLVGGVRDNAVQVATASAQIAQGNQDLSARTEAQASALQQTAASMEELRSTIAGSAEAARQAATLAHSAREVTDAGGRSVDGLVSAMEQISDSARRMQDIVGTIDSLAFQTNILALNAAVEAARAGEQGRGFAVVASEVRALAQRSSTAAREVRGLIAASQARVEDGVGHGRQVRSTMGDVVASIGRVSDLIAEVSNAAQEQARGVAQVGEAVSEMDRVTQQNAALVEESAAAAHSLHEQAQALQGAVASFRT